MAQGAFFTNLTAKSYAKSSMADPVSYEKKLELTRKYFSLESEVLEIGAGTGSTAILHAPYVKQIEGIDYASKMVDIANQKVSNEGLTNVSFRVGDVDKLTARDKQYDVVMGMNIIHLLKDQAAALKNIHALLKPGGYFISSTVCTLTIPWHFKLLIFVGCGLRILPPINVMSEEDLKNNIESAGFKIVEKWNHGKKFNVVFLVAQK